ncbi:MAG: hydantoinase/oxoprolinase N-terminal domain-containing protein [bacterium]
MASPPLGIGIDTGGTFTDIVLFDFGAGRVLRKAKTPTTHGDYTICIARAFDALALAGPETAALRRVCLSTTLATNTVAENRVHPTCLIVEPGDISVQPDIHPALVLLKSCIAFDTSEVVAVSEREVVEKVTPFAANVESFAVSGYASTRSPAHERQIAAILARAFGKPVVQGSELTHQLNFVQRARAAALNAGLLPVIVEWLGAVRAILAELGIGCPLYIVKGDGSLMEEREALMRPVQTLFSGPAASLSGGWFLSGRHDAVVIDVGGTTTDIGRVSGGHGVLKKGGVRINQRDIAVDGLDLFTHGLGGDSRFRIGGLGHYTFENRRALPFCRAAEQFAAFSPAALEEELQGSWHFGDVALLDMVGLDALRVGGGSGAPLSVRESALARALEAGPLTLRRLERDSGVAHPLGLVEDLVRRRVLIRIGLTPTDLFCADGHIPAFSRADAGHAIALFARMLDREPEKFSHEAHRAVRRQTTGLLALALAAFDPPLDADDPTLGRLVAMLLAEPGGGEKGGGEPALALEPGRPLVLVGAAARLMFGDVPGPLGGRLVNPEHGDVANAVGAVVSRFVLRETATVEPLRYGRVEVFDHESRAEFDSVAAGFAHARAQLEARLTARAGELGLGEVELNWNEEVLEEYADYSKRTRKQLVIARLEAILTGIPE